MNCPSRVDDTLAHEGWNQNPPTFAADTTTRQDLNGISNSTAHRGHLDDTASLQIDTGMVQESEMSKADQKHKVESSSLYEEPSNPISISSTVAANGKRFNKRLGKIAVGVKHAVIKYGQFVGPGFMIAVAYIDPGNYSTDVSAGAEFRFRLLFIVLMSNFFAIFLQSLCIKLGTVTGLNLAENCRVHLPKWLNYFLYALIEAAIIATDIAEVIGSAIALNLLLKVPLIAGCAITIVDVLLILIFYRPEGSMKGLRVFEGFVALLVLSVVICFCIQLSYIRDTSVGDVFRGYIPSSAIIQSDGLYASCGILGATVMPHSLYLGSGIVQGRLHDFDKKAADRANRTVGTASVFDESEEFRKHQPSLAAINYCLSYSVVELIVCLFTFALFVNSAILIVAGAALSDNQASQSADLFGIHDLLSTSLAPVAGTLFALALLFSGTSAGIVCTMAGQMVSEGALNWKLSPWLRRLITRSISIVPAIIIAAAEGRDGLTAALNGTQIALSVTLPFVSAPLIYFTCRDRYMTVSNPDDEDRDRQARMRNSWYTTTFGVLIWLVIAIMNVALLVLVGLGKA